MFLTLPVGCFRKRLEAYLPKLNERIDSLTKKLTSSVRLGNEARKRDVSGARDEYEKLNIMAKDLFDDFVSTSKRPLVDRVQLEEALSQQVAESCTSPRQPELTDDQFQADTKHYFDLDTDEMALKVDYFSSEFVDKCEEKAPLFTGQASNQEQSQEFLSETEHDELLQSSSASCESLTSTKIVFKKNTLAPPAEIANPLSPINHEALPEEDTEFASCSGKLHHTCKSFRNTSHQSSISETHSSLQIIDFSNDNNMDLI